MIEIKSILLDENNPNTLSLEMKKYELKNNYNKKNDSSLFLNKFRSINSCLINNIKKFKPNKNKIEAVYDKRSICTSKDSKDNTYSKFKIILPIQETDMSDTRVLNFFSLLKLQLKSNDMKKKFSEKVPSINTLLTLETLDLRRLQNDNQNSHLFFKQIQALQHEYKTNLRTSPKKNQLNIIEKIKLFQIFNKYENFLIEKIYKIQEKQILLFKKLAATFFPNYYEKILLIREGFFKTMKIHSSKYSPFLQKWLQRAKKTKYSTYDSTFFRSQHTINTYKTKKKQNYNEEYKNLDTFNKVYFFHDDKESLLQTYRNNIVSFFNKPLILQDKIETQSGCSFYDFTYNDSEDKYIAETNSFQEYTQEHPDSETIDLYYGDNTPRINSSQITMIQDKFWGYDNQLKKLKQGGFLARNTGIYGIKDYNLLKLKDLHLKESSLNFNYYTDTLLQEIIQNPLWLLSHRWSLDIYSNKDFENFKPICPVFLDYEMANDFINSKTEWLEQIANSYKRYIKKDGIFNRAILSKKGKKQGPNLKQVKKIRENLFSRFEKTKLNSITLSEFLNYYKILIKNSNNIEFLLFPSKKTHKLEKFNKLNIFSSLKKIKQKDLNLLDKKNKMSLKPSLIHDFFSLFYN
ncbi:MAG: hypothetical protein GY791_19305 [Alphaproteobacteria bacterium]|nr:hypothetical protein [Alphaproteobacteria bacterium]